MAVFELATCSRAARDSARYAADLAAQWERTGMLQRRALVLHRLVEVRTEWADGKPISVPRLRPDGWTVADVVRAMLGRAV